MDVVMRANSVQKDKKVEKSAKPVVLKKSKSAQEMFSKKNLSQSTPIVRKLNMARPSYRCLGAQITGKYILECLIY